MNDWLLGGPQKKKKKKKEKEKVRKRKWRKQTVRKGHLPLLPLPYSLLALPTVLAVLAGS